MEPKELIPPGWESIPGLLKRFTRLCAVLYIHFVFIPKTHYEHGFILDSYRFSVILLLTRLFGIFSDDT
jgi:hypothetical protein